MAVSMADRLSPIASMTAGSSRRRGFTLTRPRLDLRFPGKQTPVGRLVPRPLGVFQGDFS